MNTNFNQTIYIKLFKSISADPPIDIVYYQKLSLSLILRNDLY